MRTQIEAQRRYGGPWKPAELSDEAELAGGGPVVYMAGIDEPLGVADVFVIKVDADSHPELVEAARAAGFTVVDASRRRRNFLHRRRNAATSPYEPQRVSGHRGVLPVLGMAAELPSRGVAAEQAELNSHSAAMRGSHQQESVQARGADGPSGQAGLPKGESASLEVAEGYR